MVAQTIVIEITSYASMISNVDMRVVGVLPDRDDVLERGGDSERSRAIGRRRVARGLTGALLRGSSRPSNPSPPLSARRASS
jgi:hypothetical protein